MRIIVPGTRWSNLHIYLRNQFLGLSDSIIPAMHTFVRTSEYAAFRILPVHPPVCLFRVYGLEKNS